MSRGGRGGFDGTRGRGRGNDRGRGGRTRGAPVAHTNGTRNETAEVSVPTTESNAWDTAATTENTTKDTPADAESSKPAEADNTWGATATNAASTTAAAATTAASTIIPDGVKKSWASMFAPAPKPKKAPEPVEKPVELPKPEEPVEAPAVSEPEPPVPEPETVEIPEPIAPVESPAEPEVNVNLTPSKDELTETNLEQVPDESVPPPSATAASTAASSWDPRNAPGNATGNSTPYSALPSQTTAASRAPTSGFQASALKATGSSGRTPSFQRRVLDQEEAVRMPGNREVDRAAVQFGAFNLTGEDDVDGDREEPETRAQPPQHSPVAPRATLPPAPQQAAPVSETLPTPKQAPGLPAATHPTAAPGLPSPQTHPSSQSKFRALHIHLAAINFSTSQVLLNRDLKLALNWVNMADMDNQDLKSSLHCHRSHTMHSVNKHQARKAHLKVTQVNLNPRHSNNPVHSLLHPTITLLTTPLIHKDKTITVTISNNTTCNKVAKVNKMLHHLKDLMVDTMDPKLKLLVNNPNPAMQLQEQEKVRTVVTLLLTR